MLHMGYSSPSVIALDYDFTFLYKKKLSPSSDIGGDMIAFVSESTRLVLYKNSGKGVTSHILAQNRSYVQILQLL